MTTKYLSSVFVGDFIRSNFRSKSVDQHMITQLYIDWSQNNRQQFIRVLKYMKIRLIIMNSEKSNWRFGQRLAELICLTVYFHSEPQLPQEHTCIGNIVCGGIFAQFTFDHLYLHLIEV